MEKQANEATPVKSELETFVDNCVAYSNNAIRLKELKDEQAGLVNANGELRKLIVPFFKANQDKKWSELSKGIKAAIVKAGVKDVAGLLGVLRTSFEYKVLPTQQNADRFRKLETWVGWNGMVIPNTYGKVHTKEGAGKKASAPTVPASLTITAQTTDKAVDKFVNATTPSTPTPTPAVKAATPQKDTSKGEIPRANVSNSDAPIHPIEHCSLLLDQLTKNEAFREIYAPILALMLDVEKSTLTRCIVQARDEMVRGAK